MKLLTIGALAVACVAAACGQHALSNEKTQPEPQGEEKMFKAVVHVNFADAERQEHGLKNVANMIKEVQHDFEIEVVCHGAGIALLVSDQTAHAGAVDRLMKQGVRFAACENTMQAKSIDKDELLPGIVTVPSGAVEIVRKQQEGFGYFKP